MSAPLFSVILPTYNRADRLVRAMQSVVAQTETDWELLIIDDGSTDATAQRAGAFSDVRIRYLAQANAGKSAARNTGIEQARGRYLCFLDDDDYYLPDYLLGIRRVVAAAHYPVALVRTEAWQEQGDHRWPLPRLGDNPVRFVWTRGAAPAFFAIHRDVLRNCRFDPRFPFAQDTHLLLRCLLRYPVLRSAAAPTWVHVEHVQRSSRPVGRVQIEALVASRLAVGQDLLTRFGAELTAHLRAKDIASWSVRSWLRGANLAWRSGHYRLGLTYTWQALRYQRDRATVTTVLRNVRHLFPSFRAGV